MDSAPDLRTLVDDPISRVIGLVLVPLVVVAVVATFELLRVTLGRHWTLEAREGFHLRWQGSGGTWRESRAAITEVDRAIEQGDLPTTNVAASGPPESPGLAY